MTTWKKSSHSGTSNCVEVAQDPGVVRVRDSKDPGGPVLVLSREAWAAFLATVPSAASLPKRKD